MRRVVWRDLLMSGSIAILLAGCGTLGNGRNWGQDATLFPGTERLRRAAERAIRDPATWGPAAGAALFGLSDLDERLSRWASDHTPVFGSRQASDRASDRLATATHAGFLLTALATPSGDESGEWAVSKLQGVGVEYAAVEAAGLGTGALKLTVHRERPDGSDQKSFPSGHSSRAFTRAALARRNLGALSVSPGQRVVLQTGITALAAGTAWARVEAQKHFPSDVLAGAALGNLIATFVHDAFLGLDRDQGSSWALAVEPSRAGWVLAVQGHF